jgi:hypothetical protein
MLYRAYDSLHNLNELCSGGVEQLYRSLMHEDRRGNWAMHLAQLVIQKQKKHNHVKIF